MNFRLTQWPMAGRLLSALSCLLLLLASFDIQAAAGIEEVKLKAAFIYNFTLFTTWPQARRSLNLCVMGEDGYIEALSKYDGRKVLNATFHVQKLSSADNVHACEVLFLDHSQSTRIDQIRKALKGFPVLTVAESGISDPSAVMILLVRDNNRVSFEINQNVATNAGLVLSDKLLKLARKVN